MVSRREFIQAVPAGALALATGAAPGTAVASAQATASSLDKAVALVGDDVPTASTSLPARLQGALDTTTKAGDMYLHNGATGRMEEAFARLLGKEDAVFMPTGTMANQIAIRILCGDRRHLLLQKESHVYRDEEDSTAILSGINPVPIEGGTGDGLIASVEAALAQRKEDPYPIEIGAISLESPVRRLDGSCISMDVIGRIASLAKTNGIGMHLDGARLLLMSGQPGFDPRIYAEPFDTVYVSLYKYLGAPFGAVLAGSKPQMARARQLRHIFGGTIFHGWPAALLASQGLDGFMGRFAKVRTTGDALLAKLEGMPGIRVERVARASNIAILHLEPRIVEGLGKRAEAANIFVAGPEDGRLPISFNETLLRRPVEAIAAVFSP